MSKILITGASGFIGGFMVEEALNRGFEVFAGVRKGSDRTYLKDSRIHFFDMNLSDPEALKQSLLAHNKQFGTFDYVIHNAGITSAAQSKTFYQINYNYSQNLINALFETNQNLTKFIYISSLASYGPGDSITMEPVAEHHTPNPITAYGKSKLLSEQFIRAQQNFPYLIFRPTGVYGPRDKAFYMYFKMINSSLEAYIGSAKQSLSFIYVTDLVNVIFNAIESDLTNKAWFVSDGDVYDTTQLAGIIKRHLNKKTVKITLPSPIANIYAFALEKSYSLFGKIPPLNREKIREISCANWVCDILPLENDLNFQPAFNLDAGIKETAEWYKKQGWL